jgi:hypothetical protein
MKTLFIPCSFDGLPRHAGSRLIRCEWVAQYWEGAEVYAGTQSFSTADLVVFQKAYLSGRSQDLILQLHGWRSVAKQPLLCFDLCDPDFLDATHRERLLSVLPLFDFATASTAPLADWLGQYLPAYVVPDGINQAAITARHIDKAGDKPRIVWMGYQGNSGVLNTIAGAMVDLGLTGDIVAVEKPQPFAAFCQQLSEYDILLNPKPERGRFRYKSDNKTLVAWEIGVAVARDGDELAALLDPLDRSTQVEAGRDYIDRFASMPHIVARWQEVCRAEGLDATGAD